MTKKLLFVDDELVFEQAIKQRFRKEIRSKEYDIIFARSGEEALDAINLVQNNQIDLLLTDLKMPAAKVDGFQLINTLHEQNVFLKTFVISAYGDMENYKQAIRENVMLFLTKPIDIINLKPLIEEALKKQETNTEIGFFPVYQIFKELPSPRRIQLIERLIEHLELEELEPLQQKLPEKLNHQLEIIRKKRAQKELLIEKLKRGEIDENTPIELIEGYFIQEKYIPRNGKHFGPYYYLRWREDGKLKNKYLGKTNPCPKMLKPKKQSLTFEDNM